MSQAPKSYLSQYQKNIMAQINKLKTILNDLNDLTVFNSLQLQAMGLLLASNPASIKSEIQNLLVNGLTPVGVQNKIEEIRQLILDLQDKLNNFHTETTKVGQGFFGSNLPTLTPFELHTIFTKPIQTHNMIHPTIEEIRGNGVGSSKPVNSTRIEVKPNKKNIKQQLREIQHNIYLFAVNPAQLVMNSVCYDNGDEVPIEDFNNGKYKTYLTNKKTELNKKLTNITRGHGLTII